MATGTKTGTPEHPQTARQPLEQITPRFKLKWPTALSIIFMHAGLVFAPATFSWKTLGLLAVLHWFTLCLGITLGYHRLLTHRSFKAPKGLEYFLTFCGALAVQGGPMRWVATHRIHHAFTDRPQDPHSPNRGFWWAHLFWNFAYDDLIDHPTKHWRYVPEIANDPVHRFISRSNVLLQILLGAILFAWGGWPFVVWGVIVRVVFGWHTTWLVNSAAHIWGYRTYDTGEGSTNNWWVALLTFGEGWHNNHHAYPTSAAHGLRWWELDMTYLTLRLLAWTGLIREVRLPRGKPTRLPPPGLPGLLSSPGK